MSKPHARYDVRDIKGPTGGGRGLQVLGGAWGEVQLGGVAHKVDGAVVEGVPGGVPGGALVVHIGHAGVVGLVEALVEGHSALSTCDQHQAPSCSTQR